MEKFRQNRSTFTSHFDGYHGTFSRSKDYTLDSQSMTSISHAPSHLNLGRSETDIGGPFISRKTKFSGVPGIVHLSNVPPGDNGWKSSGILVPPQVEQAMQSWQHDTASQLKSYAAPPMESDNSLIVKGTTAIARSAPTSPVWDGATALAELYGGGVLKPPYATKQNTLPKNFGEIREVNPANEFLNYQFGYAPTASDILALRDAAKNSEKILAQLERDSGKVIRRKYEFPGETLASRTEESRSYPVYLGGGQPTIYECSAVFVSMQSKTVRTNRFSGAFTYHLPPKGTWGRKIAELDHLYGIRPGIDTAWNAVPFSWLADYWGNMGDVLQNVTAFAQDGLVMKYGYITSHTETTTTWQWSYGVSLESNPGVYTTRSGTSQQVSTSLTRMPASPFGFGPTGVPLSGRQKAIVAALGLSRR